MPKCMGTCPNAECAGQLRERSTDDSDTGGYHWIFASSEPKKIDYRLYWHGHGGSKHARPSELAISLLRNYHPWGTESNPRVRPSLLPCGTRRPLPKNVFQTEEAVAPRKKPRDSNEHYILVVWVFDMVFWNASVPSEEMVK